MSLGACMFEKETDLTRYILDFLPKYFRGTAQCFRSSVEVSVGGAIADVVAVMWDEPLVSPPPLSVRDSVVLATLRRLGPTRVDILEGRCGLHRGALRTGDLDRLEELCLVCRGPGGRVSLATDWARRIHIIAIEVKLRDWRSAIRQAQRYLRYADEAFVALPDRTAQRLGGALKSFQCGNIGLLSVGPELTIKVPAAPSVMHDWRREFAASRLLAERTPCST